MEQLNTETNEYYSGKRDRKLPFVPEGATYWRPEDDTPLRQSNYITYESQIMRKVLLKPLMGAIVAKLMETSEVRLFIDVLRHKENGGQTGTTVGWHIDRHYWQMFTSDKMLTAFVPMHDCYEEYGKIVMVDGSNNWTESAEPDASTSLHFAKRELSDLDQKLAAEAKARACSAERDSGFPK